MKILLFGEYSGLFNCLKDGLVANGHDVFLASDGNGFKNYPSDYRWDTKLPVGRFKRIFEIGKIFYEKKLFSGYDAVLLIAPTIFSHYRCFFEPVFNMLINNNEKVFLSGAGMEAIGFNYWYASNEKYHNYVKGYFNDENPVTRKYGRAMYGNQKLMDWGYELLDRINGYIPIWYEYAQPFRTHPKLKETIRIPINVSKYQYKPNKVGDKIVFFHGIASRRTCKGTSFIVEAFDRMRAKYGDVAEFRAVGGLPFDEYMKLLDNTNVILDDANSYSIAMNGLFSLAKGKIVMGGAEPVANAELKLEYNPVYNLTPDVDQICDCIEDVIRRKEEIEAIGLQGRKFVEEYHDYRDVARKYVEVFNEG